MDKKVVKTLILGFLLASSVASAARLEDVRILTVIPGKDNFQLKLQAKEAPTGSYFFLDITKSDPESFEKIMYIIKKMMHKNKYRLDLDIPSFSASPSGSYYKSDGIMFSSSSEREPNAVGTKKIKNK
jgi:hypothetical protein